MPNTLFLLTASLLGALAALVLVAQLRRQVRGLRWAKRRSRSGIPDISGHPRVVVIIALNGNENQLRENLAAWMFQDWFPRELVFVAGDANDAAVPVVRSLMAEHRLVPARLIFSGLATRTGQRASQLAFASQLVDEETSYVVFTTANSLPRSGALRWLIAGLDGGKAGIVTGSRWLIPRRQTLGNRLHSALVNRTGDRPWWRRSDSISPAVWGIRRDLLEQMRLDEIWDQALEVSWPTFEAAKIGGQRIVQEPLCVTESTVDVHWKHLLNAGLRRQTVHRTYASRDWWLSLATRSAVLMGMETLATAACLLWWSGRPGPGAVFAAAAATLFVAGAVQSLLRQRRAKLLIPSWKSFRPSRWFDCHAWVLVESIEWALQIASLFVTRVRLGSQVWRVGSAGVIRMEAFVQPDLLQSSGAIPTRNQDQENTGRRAA